MWTTNEVLCRLRNIRKIRGQKSIIASDNRKQAVIRPALDDFLNACENEEALIAGWLEILPDEERFIVQKHLIDGLDWARTIVEHELRWGIQNGRSERTLKRIQAKAIKRIVDCLSQLEDIENKS